jgi:hypothetical protein
MRRPVTLARTDSRWPDPQWSAITRGLSAAKGAGTQDDARPEDVTFQMSTGRIDGGTKAVGGKRSGT